MPGVICASTKVQSTSHRAITAGTLKKLFPGASKFHTVMLHCVNRHRTQHSRRRHDLPRQAVTMSCIKNFSSEDRRSPLPKRVARYDKCQNLSKRGGAKP